MTGAPDILPGSRLGIRKPAHVRRFFRQQLGIDTVTRDRRQQEIGEHAGEAVGIDDILDAAIDDHLLVGVLRIQLAGRQETRAHVSEVGAEHLGGADLMAVADAAAKHQAAVPKLANLAHQRKCALVGGVAAGAAADADQSVGAALDRFAGMQRIDDIAEYDAAIAVHRLDGAARIAETGNDQRHLVRDDDLKVGLVARVGAMHDKIDGVRRNLGGGCASL